MSGCFGNDPEDRAREAELNRYLDSLDDDEDDIEEMPDDEDYFPDLDSDDWPEDAHE